MTRRNSRAPTMAEVAQVKDENGWLMRAVVSGEFDDESSARQLSVYFEIGGRRLGFVKVSRLTDATILFELNVKGEKRALAYTIGEGHDSPND